MSKSDPVSDIGGAEELGGRPSIVSARMPWIHDGRPWEDIRADLIALKSEDYDWRGGRIPIYVYYDDDELLSVSREAYNLYFSENALGRNAFPSLVRMEEDLVKWSLALFNAPAGADGSFTSGGTESIFLALKTARTQFRATVSKSIRPAVVLPRTAHPAFDKAAYCLEIDVVRVDVGTDLRVDVDRLEAAIDDRTLMVVGSAPCYPYGVYDSISTLGKIARARGVWFHVDACLGGFLAPFARDEGFSVPEFDFSIPGVTSLSADLHKHGFCARGSSVVLYRSASIKVHQAFRFDDWPRGTYSTETFLGSRPGGSVASAWAVSQYLGRAGYRRLARKTMEAKLRLVRGVESITGLQVLYPSDLSIVLYRSVDSCVDINAVGDCLTEQGWFVGRSREPMALHFAVNAVHAPVVERYLSDLERSVKQVRASGKTGRRNDLTY
ncbi:pyridoxal phosphate-dependent decarboxylase family protein [Steroidobacter agaridevorans]|uniref:pyridoxal phosphate-dependent decarboxylase family protein n=1 Tax=Steroidobacter agaridevorans TaxID=2695856 RepID=UPI00192A3B48|nr:aspartate aminotransferase family protein [Steroidobacter agaridevorans]